jgi:hypothetical protein
MNTEQEESNAVEKKNPVVLIAKIFSLAILLVVLSIAVLFPSEIHEYQIYLFQPHPNMDFTFENVYEEWNELDLKARFPEVALRCQNEELAGGMGDRSCYADVKKHNDVSAMLVAFFFREGKLESATIHVPIWAHRNMFRDLLRTYGVPKGAQPKPINGARLIGWELLDGGAVFYNRDRLSPIRWSAIYWSSHRACLRNGCFLSKPVDVNTTSLADI